MLSPKGLWAVRMSLIPGISCLRSCPKVLHMHSCVLVLHFSQLAEEREQLLGTTVCALSFRHPSGRLSAPLQSRPCASVTNLTEYILVEISLWVEFSGLHSRQNQRTDYSSIDGLIKRQSQGN